MAEPADRVPSASAALLGGGVPAPAGSAGPVPTGGDAINLVDDSGKVVNADTATASDLLRGGGYRLATNEETAADLKRQEFSDVGSQLGAAAEGAAAELTFGGSDVAIQAGMLGDGFAEDSRNRAEHSSTARTVGRVGAGIATALATGGTGAIAKTLARTPAGAILRGVNAAEDAVRATKLGRTGALMASGTIEGALFGAGEGISQAVLSPEGADRSAEAIFASAMGRGLDGMLLGGGAGLGLGLAAKGASKAAGALGRRAKAFRETIDAGRASKPGKLAPSSSAPVERVSGEYGQLVDNRAPMQRVRDQFRARRTAEGEISDHAHYIAKREDELNAIKSRVMVDEGSKKIKAKRVRELMKDSAPDDTDAVYGAFEGFTTSHANRLDDLLHTRKAELTSIGGGANSKVRQMRDNLQEMAARMDDVKAARAAGKTDGEAVADLYMMADNFKTSMGRVADSKNRWLQEQFRPFYQETREFLTDKTLWGGAVVDKIQTPMNAAWTGYIPTQRARNKLMTRLDVTDASGAGLGFEREAATDPKSVAGLLRGLADPLDSMNRRAFVEGGRSRLKLLEQMGDSYGASAKEIKRARQIHEEIEGAMAKAERVSMDAKAADELLEELSAIPGAGGVVQVGAGVADRASKLQSLHQSAKAGQASLSQKMSSLVRGAKERTKGATRKARNAGMVAGVSASQRDDSPKAKRDRYSDAAKQLQEFERDPQGGTRRVVSRAGGGQGAPMLSQSLAATAARGAQHLLDTMPRSRRRALDPIDEIDAKRVSDTEISQWLDRVDAVENPLGVIDEVSEGRVPRHKIETIKQVYPSLFRDMQDAALDELAELEEPPPYDTLKAIGLVLDLPVDDTLTPSFVAAMQRSAQSVNTAPATEPAVTPGNARAPSEMDEMHSTRADRLAGGA